MSYNKHFEIEKYIQKMENNPYVDELKKSLKNQQINSIKSYLNDESINYLEIETLKNIFIKCPNEDALKQFINKFQHSITTELSITDKLNIINSNLDNFSYNYNSLSNTNNINPTKLRISTSTICGCLGTNINTDNIYKNFVSSTPPVSIGIVGCKANDYPLKGFFKKKKLANFFNSATLNIKIEEDNYINFKIFKNGKIQLTGVSSELLGKKSIDIVIDYIKSFVSISNKIVDDIKTIKLTEYRTVLINSDYFCGSQLQREILYKILYNKYNLSVSYDSENYPGVKLQYFWNKTTINSNNEGICLCTPKCIGKGDGLTTNNCKKITISTFQSGKIIITGGRNIEQINTAYKFFNTILKNNYTNIVKETINTELIFNKNNKYYFLKKNNIINYNLYQSLIK